MNSPSSSNISYPKPSRASRSLVVETGEAGGRFSSVVEHLELAMRGGAKCPSMEGDGLTTAAGAARREAVTRPRGSL